VTGSRPPLRLLGPLLAASLAACSPREGVESAGSDLPPEARSAEPSEHEELYALGAWLGGNLAGVKIVEQDLVHIQAGLEDALLGRPLRAKPREIGEHVQKLLRDRRAATAAEEKRAGAPLLAEAKQQPGARRTPNGVVYQSLAEGQGASPRLTDRVKVQYEGKLRDGTIFDSSYERGKPAVFSMTGVVPCWSEALQLMKPGGKARLTCASDLAYGDRGLPGRILPGATLRFEIELLEVVSAPVADAAPP
jgi:FKBP-type peptidyl-prolyl cis-trans isomerase